MKNQTSMPELMSDFSCFASFHSRKKRSRRTARRRWSWSPARNESRPAMTSMTCSISRQRSLMEPKDWYSHVHHVVRACEHTNTNTLVRLTSACNHRLILIQIFRAQELGFRCHWIQSKRREVILLFGR